MSNPASGINVSGLLKAGEGGNIKPSPYLHRWQLPQLTINIRQTWLTNLALIESEQTLL
jgi:hypothetical protein